MIIESWPGEPIKLCYNSPRKTENGMGIDPQKKAEVTLPFLYSLFSPPLPLEVGPLNPARGSSW